MSEPKEIFIFDKDIKIIEALKATNVWVSSERPRESDVSSFINITKAEYESLRKLYADACEYSLKQSVRIRELEDLIYAEDGYIASQRQLTEQIESPTPVKKDEKP